MKSLKWSWMKNLKEKVSNSLIWKAQVEERLFRREMELQLQVYAFHCG